MASFIGGYTKKDPYLQWIIHIPHLIWTFTSQRARRVQLHISKFMFHCFEAFRIIQGQQNMMGYYRYLIGEFINETWKYEKNL